MKRFSYLYFKCNKLCFHADALLLFVFFGSGGGVADKLRPQGMTLNVVSRWHHKTPYLSDSSA